MPNTTQSEIINRLSKLPQALETMGWPSLRPWQAEPVQRTIAEEDQLVVLPTGGGKTGVYVIPTLCSGYRALIFSPLIALIKDQLEGLQARGLRARGISSGYSTVMNNMALRDWSSGAIDFLLIAPERTDSEEFLRSLRIQPPDLVVVDEIHVAAKDAFNFRPAYRNIAPFIKELNPRVFLGLTATMDDKIEKDIRNIFDLRDTKMTVSHYTRENLNLKSQPWQSDFNLLSTINQTKGSTIVYFSTVKRLEACYETIGERVKGGACIFHGQLAKGTKTSNQTMFMDGSVRVIFATNSFGMGVDKSDIRSVIYATVPGSIEELWQGFGRGGRDGEPCECVLFWDDNSVRIQEFFIQIGHPSRRDILLFLRAMQQRLDRNGLCHETIGSLLRAAGVHNAMGQAMSSILVSEGIVERVNADKPLRVKVLSKPDTAAMERTINKVIELGARNPHDGFYEINLEFLAEELDRQPAQVIKNLRSMEKANNVALEDSGSTKPLRICKEIEDIDFEGINKRHNNAVRKLLEVEEFYKLPDDEKHPYLNKYFHNAHTKNN
jgi:ATP-dependent DNA helicase RecQ